MSDFGDTVNNVSCDFWFKVVEFLQQNWALIESNAGGAVVYFLSDTGGVFDEITFDSEQAARSALRRNGFRLFAEDPEAHEFIEAPRAPFERRPHANGAIYSSGRFWK